MIFMNNVCMIDAVVFQNMSILKKMRMFCLRISAFCLGMKILRRKNFDSSDALSDQVLSLDIVEDGGDRETRR